MQMPQAALSFGGSLQGLLQRLSSATQAFNFRALSEHPAAARHIAEATINTGTYEQLLRAAVAAIVRPSSRFCLLVFALFFHLFGALAWSYLACESQHISPVLQRHVV